MVAGGGGRSSHGQREMLLAMTQGEVRGTLDRDRSSRPVMQGHIHTVQPGEQSTRRGQGEGDRALCSRSANPPRGEPGTTELAFA